MSSTTEWLNITVNRIKIYFVPIHTNYHFSEKLKSSQGQDVCGTEYKGTDKLRR